MGGKRKLNEFECSEVIGCHHCGKYVREISVMLQVARYTVNDVILKWKRTGATTVDARPGRPFRLVESDYRVLKRVVKANRIQSAEIVCSEFQEVSGCNVSTMTVRREL